MPVQVRTRPLFDLSLEVGPAHDMRGPDGTGRLIYHVTGGAFDGARLRGRVLPVSGDWVRAEAGFGRIDVRLMLETDGGALIYMRYEGINTLGPEHRARLAEGKPLDPESYYFRTAAHFETADEGCDWLNRVVAVGVGSRTPSGVEYAVHEVL
ncbi:hypothetical protein OB2597_07905 [Pseudooceanicola batsensis HTCC2597]|uniref:UPF0311 protein OB2597_07905 n=1 Tax=Pseudooceanicola batsensis (strain ATCC BAA-863 / DSM 15984 / KCTC 12145 / HTCC2597) TaxID=252305 RepID=A3TU66_PSEBH|nr:DUF3237 domain-containing protein [Pseudooceanicola batsensis]EAQ05193.1 hypothetical protein OB2597_07905 [Pseudooceanicola batsensis HTCC2597]